jgi:peptidyl-prolyl cis-trans isomerase SurA
MKRPEALVASLSLLLLAAPGGGELIERVIVKVNGDIVTLTDFTARQIAAAQAARVTADRIEAFLRDNNARILQESIDDLLIVQHAADVGVRMRPEMIAEILENIKKENNIASDADLQEQLRREGMTLDDLKRNIERSVLTRQVLYRELDSKVTVTEADSRREYEARRAEYTKAASVRLQEILVPGDDASASALARDLVARARAGEDFAELARAHSSAPTRAAGGDLGRIARGEMNPEIERAAFALGPGEVSEPLAVPGGYRILRVAERDEGSVTPFEEVQAEIQKRLTQARRAELYEGFLEGLRKTATIDIRVREVPLKVELPTTGSILEAPTEGLGAPPTPLSAPSVPRPGAEESEFTTTPQARPERVAPQTAPGPAPSPTPTPPPPSRQ